MQTKFILVRHGEPRYDEVRERGYVGMGYELGKLTENGEKQAEKVAKNALLKGADLIISSPYTRALQTAAIISNLTGIKLKVENDLHEWMPDTKFIFDYEVSDCYQAYFSSKGVQDSNQKYRFESYKHVKERVEKTLDKYMEYKKVIVVCHGIVISTLTHFDDVIEHCGIREVNR
ncbi:MAG: histidine phosphatase family protein [Acholeplasmataceae bacterium]|nr:histidine phosphatase family protein [Acholeplasmataceae bacterium]